MLQYKLHTFSKTDISKQLNSIKTCITEHRDVKAFMPSYCAGKDCDNVLTIVENNYWFNHVLEDDDDDDDLARGSILLIF